MSSTSPDPDIRADTRMAAEIAEQPEAARRTIEHLAAEQSRLRALPSQILVYG